MSNPENQRPDRPIPITAEEFDRKVEAGENIDDHLDWDSAVLVAPGEMSPGQKLSVAMGMIDDLLRLIDLPASLSSTQESLRISLSPMIIIRIAKEAMSRGISRDELVQSLIEEKLDEQLAVK